MKLSRKFIPLLATVSLFAAMSAYGGFAYSGFFSIQVFFNLLIDNAFLLVVAVGMTFVILSGGIDLSVGSVVALHVAGIWALQSGLLRKAAEVIVPDFQLSLAIGKEGQNARLAAKLTGAKIDIQPDSILEDA